MIENRMIVDSEWTYVEPPMCEPEEKEPGYINLSDDTFVPDEDALEYAREHEAQEDMTDEEFTEWFYSGNWIRSE